MQMRHAVTRSLASTRRNAAAATTVGIRSKVNEPYEKYKKTNPEKSLACVRYLCNNNNRYAHFPIHVTSLTPRRRLAFFGTPPNRPTVDGAVITLYFSSSLQYTHTHTYYKLLFQHPPGQKMLRVCVLSTPNLPIKRTPAPRTQSRLSRKANCCAGGGHGGRQCAVRFIHICLFLWWRSASLK